MTAFEFAALLGAKRVGRGKWIAKCPSHKDRHPSLSIAEGRKHPVVFRCMSAGCTQEEVLRAIGITWKDLLGERPVLNRDEAKRFREEQTLDALRNLKTALVSPAGAFLASRSYCLAAARQSLERRIRNIEERLSPKLKSIREREAKTARFVTRWGWDKLWELYFAKGIHEV